MSINLVASTVISNSPAEMLRQQPGNGQTVVVGMSGGVDSSVTALLLKRQGYKVIGLFMKNWEGDDDGEFCSTREDLVDVASVADVIGIELDVVNFSAEYKDRVFVEFLAEYQAGRTPNPDILCNSEIKFRCFLDHAMTLGADKIATGHYAQVREWVQDGKLYYQLLKGEDSSKDQSYFLYRLTQEQLSKTLFPLGSIYKRDVRKIAEQEGLHVFNKKDSTGICFIGERPFRDFLQRYLPREKGEIRGLDSNQLLGEHDGLMYHTIGQRKGLHIGGLKGQESTLGEHEAWYVAGKDIAYNRLLVVQGHDHPALLRDQVLAGQLSWVSGLAPRTQWVYTAKPRYRSNDAPCQISRLEADTLELGFAQAQWALTPGQSLVIYESKVCLGGGIID